MFNIQTSSYSKIDWWDTKYIRIPTFILFISWLSIFSLCTTLGMVPIDEEDAPMASPPSEVRKFD